MDDGQRGQVPLIEGRTRGEGLSIPANPWRWRWRWRWPETGTFAQDDSSVLFPAHTRIDALPWQADVGLCARDPAGEACLIWARTTVMRDAIASLPA